MIDTLEALLFSTLDFAPPLVLAASGAVLSERSGVVNLGLEGMMRAGAFTAAVCALVMPTGVAVLVGMGAGGVLGALHALLTVRFRSDQIVSGMALNVIVLALGAFLLESWFAPSGTPPIAQLHRWDLPGLGEVPLLRAFGGHSALTYVALAVPVLLHVWLWRTPAGLRVRVIGEKPAAAATVGIRVNAWRFACVVGSGLLAGLGGSALSTSTLDRFENHMPAGMGFMALAAMVFGRWQPLGAFAAALFFASANAARIGLAVTTQIPHGVLLAAPYLLALVVVSVQKRGRGAPAALGTAYDPQAR